MNIDWIEGATHYGIGDDCPVFFRNIIKGESYEFKNVYSSGIMADWLECTGYIDIPNGLVERPKKQGVWDGEGLPPAGLDVEVMQGGFPSVAFDWQACKVLAINIGSDERPQVITRDFHGDVAIYYPGIDSVYFRPIKTAEQVAAEEREKAIEEMVFGVCGCEPDGGNTSAFMMCGFLYDAGYRKQ